MTTLPGSKPVEETEAFRIASLHSRLAACDQLLEPAARLEELKVELESAYAELLRHEHQINQEHEKQLAEARDRVATAEAGCAKANERHAVASRQLIAARDRNDSLAKDDFASENQQLIDEEIRTRSTSVRDELSQAHKQLDEHNRANTAISAKLSALQRDLDNATADLEIFTDSEVPDNYAQLHQDAIEEARNSIDAELRSLETALTAASKEAEQVRASISYLAKKIEAFESRQNELKRLSSQPLWRKLESSAWWGSFGPDYGKRIAALRDQLDKSKQQLASIETSQQKKRGEQANLAAGRGKRLDEAVIGSAAQLRTACQAKIDALHNEIASANDRLQAASHGIASTSSDILNLEGELDRITTEARESAIAALKKEAAHEVEAATTRLRETQQLVSDNQDAYAKLAESLTSLESSFATSKADRLRGDGERTAAVKMLFDRTAEELSLSMAKHGINFTNDEFRGAIETARRQAEDEIKRQTADQKSEFFRDHAKEGRRPMDAGADDSVDVAGDQRAAGNLYFDFAKNEDDNQDKRGRTYPGLRTQLEDLRKRHKNAFFAKIDDGDDVFATLVDAMFPEGATKSYVVCNLSLHDQPYLSIRPQIIGPRLERLIPRGMSLAICGRLWDNQRDLDNPVFLAQRVVDISHSPTRPFERVITGFVFTEGPNVYPASQRQQNILDAEFIRRLPAISVETRSRLADWHAYLAWKERLIHARLVGLRYLGVDVTSDGRVQFLTASPSQQDFERIRRTLRNDELYAYGLRYSEDPWEFEYNDQHRERGAELGDFIGQDTIPQAPDTDTDGIPWDDPFFAQVSFRLPEDAQREFEGIIDAGGSVEEAARQYLQTVHPQGFLALSVVGDMALIRRQRSELQLLQEQSGFAPFLSSYLFDISAASEPSQLIEISDDNWSQPRLNDDQRLAVRKMVSTPDLAMVQGPPGTGKTTMIAEAIWQYARQGKSTSGLTGQPSGQ